MDKITRYNWDQVIGENGEYKLIPKCDLKIDTTYQRGVLSNSKILKYASKWNYTLCGVLMVAIRENGDLYVLDGQQRLAAAMKRDDVNRLPCIVYQSKGPEWEAGIFWRFNTVNKKLNAHELFKAKLAEGDKNAMALNEFITSRGYVIGRHRSNAIDFIGSLSLYFSRYPEIAKRAFDLCTSIHVGSRSIKLDLFLGMFVLVRNDVQLDSHAIYKLREAGLDGIERAIRNQVIADGRDGYISPAKAILKIANYKRTTRRIEFPDRHILSVDRSRGNGLNEDVRAIA